MADEDEMTEEQAGEAATAMVAWLESQDISPADFVNVFTMLLARQAVGNVLLTNNFSGGEAEINQLLKSTRKILLLNFKIALKRMEPMFPQLAQWQVSDE